MKAPLSVYKGGTAVMVKIPRDGCKLIYNAAIARVIEDRRWEAHDPDEYHLTLQFIGRDLEASRVASTITAAFAFSIGRQAEAIKLKFTGALEVLFTKKGRYLVAPVDRDDLLLGVHKELGRALEQMGVRPKNDFRPHVTLAETTEPVGRHVSAFPALTIECRALTVKYGPYRMTVEL